MKIKTRRSHKNDKKLLKDVEKQDPKAFSELCNLLLKEGVVNVLQSVKSNKIYSNTPDLGDKIILDNGGGESLLSSPKKPSSLPRLKTLREKLDSPKDYPSPNSKSLTSAVHSRASPLPPLSSQLTPLPSLQNSVQKAAFKSRVGQIKGKPKVRNQDSIIIKPFLQNTRGQYLFAICDGHGPEGHLISEYLKEAYPINLEMLLPTCQSRPDRIAKALKKANKNTSSDLVNSKIDCLFSGCTMVSVVVAGNVLVCSNVGDCKAVVATFNGKWDAFCLTQVHTLDNEMERQRMIAKNARVEEEVDSRFIEKVRVFRAYMGSQNTPGLEITRSIGDKYGKYIGVISKPYTMTLQLLPIHKFLILGSSGFWKVFTDLDAITMVAFSWQNGNIESSKEDLMTEANRRWKLISHDKEDLSIIVVYLEVS
jgi:serine/threonine protein phosphatase PrpC